MPHTSTQGGYCRASLLTYGFGTHTDCRDRGCWRYRAGLLDLGQEWDEAETTKEQFSEEILIGEGRRG